MASKKNSDQSENLRQAVKSFRDVVDALSHPLPSGLENIILVERLCEDLNDSLPLVDFSPFDGLQSDTNIETGTNPATDKTHRRNRNNDSERYHDRQPKDGEPQTNSLAKRNKQDHRSQSTNGSPPCKGNNGNVVAMNDSASSVSRVQRFTVRDTTLELPTKHNNKSVRQASGFDNLNVATSINAPIEPLSSAANTNQSPLQSGDALENTLVVVDNLVKRILDEETSAKQEKKANVDSNYRRFHERTDNAFNKASTISTDASSVAMAPWPAELKGRSLKHSDTASHLQGQRDNTPASSSYSGAGGTYEKDAKSNISQVAGNDLTINSRQTLSNSLAQIGMMAEELLLSQTDKSVKSKMQIDSNTLQSDEQGGNYSRLNIEDAHSKQSMKFHLQKGDTPSRQLSNATSADFAISMAVNTLDKDALTTLVNEVLVEQAKRHGVDLS